MEAFNLSNPNSQSFDEVLEKLKQSMKAARSGGWIDSDSGSELEIALEHSPHGGQVPGHPSRNGSVPRPINNHQHSLYIKDGVPGRRGDLEDKPHANLNPITAPLSGNQKPINPRVVDVAHPKTHPLTIASLNNHLISHSTSSSSQEPRHSPLFDTPNSPYVPRTPSTPVSAGTSSGSPYVRHHFKWEYLPSSTISEGAHQSGCQPRFVESSSPPHNINFDETYWQKGFNQKESTYPTEASPFHNEARHAFQRHVNASSNFTFATHNGRRTVSYSPVHSKSQSPSQQGIGSGHNSCTTATELSSSSMEFLNRPPPDTTHKPWVMPAPPHDSKSFNLNAINPASVSSVPFSLAPAAPVRFSAPEVDHQLKANSLARQASSHSPVRESDAAISSRDANPANGQSVLPASASSAFLKHSAEEREKQAIRARLMGSSSIDNFQTRLQSFNKPFGHASQSADSGHLSQVVNLPHLFQQLRFPHSTQPISAAPIRAHSASESSSLRSISATYPINHSYGSPIFYSSNPHGPVSRTSPFTGASLASSPNNASQISQLSPKSPLTPIGFGVNGHLHTPNLSVPYSPTPSVNKSSFIPVIVPAVPGIGGPVTTPLPGQVQPEEVRKSVKTQPPVVNTGNSGAMVPQPGDWMCICGFVNWRRRKVCMRCFPFADGNDSVGAMMALNAQRAALLAAGVQLPKEQPMGTQAISNPSPPMFQRPPIPSFQEPVHQSADQQPSFGQAFNGPDSAFNTYPRSSEPAGRLNSQPQRVGLNPFDKPSSLGPISPTPGINLNRSPDGAQQIYLEVTPQEPIKRELEVPSTISHPDKGSKSLRARLVAPGEEQQLEPNGWDDVLPKSPRPRSFSVGDKSVWEPNEKMGHVGGMKAQGVNNSQKLENNPIEEETNGLAGSEEASAGSQVGSGRLVPHHRQQELHTINNNGSTVNRQRTTTSPTSSWQAIKALWQ
ncbi:hypothetical protein PtA15_11A90 [Puccinia triticina]|uniref:RanBP2-type domain-containing protein n=1 Tax=Puccinia triticina TaxID=208348 RepID=A0ABY7CWU8_9BASI|nr:uncharacterized protein PtA15_11A90 [Puccinia triticina]WAQ89403.1 hypothetical protein PtA15_11A90 [Puccinia triticina]